jgi:hypothetical protein
LQEAAAVLILAGQTAGRELERKRILDLADLGAAGMAGGHNALVVKGSVLGHCTWWLQVPGMHEEHWRQGHLCPGDQAHQQRSRNRLLHHAALVWQATIVDDVTAITSGAGFER